MARLGIQVAINFAGETAKVVSEAIRKMAGDVEKDLGRISKATRGIEGDIKGFKKMLGGALIGKVLIQGALGGLEALDRQFKILGPSGKEAIAGIDKAMQGLMSLDVVGFAEGLGQAFAAAWLKIDGTADAIARAEAEIAARGKGGQNAPAFRAQAGKNALIEIFGDPEKLLAEAEKLGTAIADSLAPKTNQRADAVRSMLDSLEKAGVAAPASLGKIAAGWGVVSSATERATEKAIAESEKRQAQAEREAEKLKDLALQVGAAFAAADAKRKQGLIDSALNSPETKQLTEDLKRAAQLTQETATSEERRLQAIGEAQRLYDLHLISAQTLDRVLLANADKFTVIRDLVADTAEHYSQIQRQILRGGLDGFIGSFGNSLGAAVYQAFNGGNVIDAFVKTLKQSLVGTLAQVFADLAVNFGRRLAAEVAAARLADSSSGGSGSLMGALKAVFGKGGSSAVSGASMAGTIAVAAIVAYGIWSQKQAQLKRYDSSAGAALGGAGVIGGSGTGKYGNQIGQGIAAILNGIQQATGQLFTVLPNTIAKIRNDGKAFQVYIQNELIGTFKNANDAALAAAKASFEKSNLAGVLDPVIASALRNFQGKAEEFAGYIAQVQNSLDVARGVSDVAIALRNLDVQAANLVGTLTQAGMSFQEAGTLALQGTLRSLMAIRQQITGENDPKAELEAKKADAALWNAKFLLLVQETQAERAQLAARIEILRNKVQLGAAEINAEREYLEGRVRVARATVELNGASIDAMVQQLAALDAVLAQLDKVKLIDIGKLKLGGGSGNFGGHVAKFGGLVDTFKSAVNSFRDAIMAARLGESTSPLTERERLTEAFTQFQTLLTGAKGGNVTAAQQLAGAYSQLLEMAKSFSGGGSGLDFLGLGGNFKDFFAALEAMSLGFVNGPKPGKLYEGNVWTDQRIVEAQNRTHREVAAHREKSAQQNRELIQNQQKTISLLEAQLTEMKRAGGTTRLRAANG